MIFPYLPLPTRRPVPSLGGASVRFRPILPVSVHAGSVSRLVDGCLDSGSDDTVFPASLARKLGIDLDGAPTGEVHPVGGTGIPYRYATVALTLTDGVETFEWTATVGFVDLPMRWALLGHAGFLNFFDAELRGERREVELVPNAFFTGTYTRP